LKFRIEEKSGNECQFVRAKSRTLFKKIFFSN
jgi:hypothetical protein